MSKVLFNQNINVAYGQYYIDKAIDFDNDDDDFDEDDEFLLETAFEEQKNGLCGACHEGKLFLVSGPSDGTINVKVELHDKAPEVDDSHEDIVECYLTAKDDELHLCEWAQEEAYKLNLPKDNYAVRYSIKGMDLDYGDDDDWDEPIQGQHYLIQLWPASGTEDNIIKSESKNGQYWHKELGV